MLTGSVVSTSISSIVDPLEEDIVEVISELTVSIRDLDLNMVVSLSVTTVCISLSDANISVRVDIVTSGSNVSFLALGTATNDSEFSRPQCPCPSGQSSYFLLKT